MTEAELTAALDQRITQMAHRYRDQLSRSAPIVMHILPGGWGWRASAQLPGYCLESLSARGATPTETLDNLEAGLASHAQRCPTQLQLAATLGIVA